MCFHKILGSNIYPFQCNVHNELKIEIFYGLLAFFVIGLGLSSTELIDTRVLS